MKRINGLAYCSWPLLLIGGRRCRAGSGRQRLQLVRLYRRRGPQAVHRGNRHQGRLRRLRQQRHRRDQAARRRLGLRHRRADRLEHVAPDQGRHAACRSTSRSSPTSSTCGRFIMESLANYDPGNAVRRQLHVGDRRDRHQRRQGQGAPRHRGPRHLGHRASSRRTPPSSPTAASTCSMRRRT